MKFDFEFKISFNSLTGAINIIEKVKPQLDEASFNSLTGAINIFKWEDFKRVDNLFQFLKWYD